jgi:hypothetical protein
MKGLNTFLDGLFESETGFVYSPTKNPNDGSWNQNFFKWPEDKSDLINHITESSKTLDVYIAPAIFNLPDSGKSSFKSTRYLWTEFDGNTPQSYDPCPEPSMVIQSSDPTHCHAYWRLSERIVSPVEVENLNRSITYNLGADSSSWDCNQVLRPPGTFNHKRGTDTFIVSTEASSYSVNDFDNVPAIQHVEVDVLPTAIPDVASVILRYAFPNEVISLFKNNEIELGDRSTALMRLGYYCAEMGMSDPEMLAVLLNADDRWGKFRDRTDRHRRLLDLVAKVRIKVPRDLVLDDIENIPLYGFDSFLKSEITVEWAIEGLLERSGYMLLTGPSGVGKTQFSLQCAIHLALGKKFLDLNIDKPHKIVMFSLEMGHAPLKVFLSKMSESLTSDELDMLENNLLVVPLGEPWYLDAHDGQQRMVSMLEDLKPDGIIIDSVGSTSTGQVSDESTVKKLMDFNDRLRNRFKVFTWWIHHNRKSQADNKKPNKMADVYGNQYLVNRATSVYCLWPSTRGVIEIIPLKKRLAEIESPWKVQRLSDLSFTVVKVVTFKSMDEDTSLSISSEGSMITSTNGISDI